jgi:hypothetical protein
VGGVKSGRTYSQSPVFIGKLYHIQPRRLTATIPKRSYLIHDINLLGDSVNTIKENTETLLEANSDIGVETNAEKAKYMIMSRHQN